MKTAVLAYVIVFLFVALVVLGVLVFGEAPVLPTLTLWCVN
jgi:hypothetical protein